VQQRKLDEQLTTEKNVTKTQLSKKAKNCPTPIVMATPTQQTKVQSKAMYDEEFQQMGAGMMVTGQYKVPTDPANDPKRRLLERGTHRGLHETRTNYAARKEGVFMEKDTTGEVLSQGNPRCSNQTSFSIQRMLVHMDNFQCRTDQQGPAQHGGRHHRQCRGRHDQGEWD
jgi:hypothetical protein